ncbi:hypothetical protein [Thermococcus sp.]|uniref:hypothetical protein n=1 Tax=Thermococcus sp. TaxID=35749 RepID=UPI002619F281|nr:hypothetical protein [Thermococcus sp.]
MGSIAITSSVFEDGIPSEGWLKNFDGGARAETNPKGRNAWSSGFETSTTVDDRHHRSIEVDRGLKILGLDQRLPPHGPPGFLLLKYLGGKGVRFGLSPAISAGKGLLEIGDRVFRA